jgi:hypothetical protein
MEARPKRQSTMEKDYREKKRSRRLSSSEMVKEKQVGIFIKVYLQK